MPCVHVLHNRWSICQSSISVQEPTKSPGSAEAGSDGHWPIYWHTSQMELIILSFIYKMFMWHLQNCLVEFGCSSIYEGNSSPWCVITLLLFHVLVSFPVQQKQYPSCKMLFCSNNWNEKWWSDLMSIYLKKILFARNAQPHEDKHIWI